MWLHICLLAGTLVLAVLAGMGSIPHQDVLTVREWRILILLLLKGLRKSLMLQINFTTLMLRFKKRVLRIHMTIMINIIGFMQIHSTIIRHLNMQRLLNQLKSMQMMHMNLQRKSLPRLKCFLMLRQKNIRYL